MLTVCSKCLLRNRGNALDNIMYSYYRVRWLALCYHRNCTAETAVRLIQPSPYAYPPPPTIPFLTPTHTTCHHTGNITSHLYIGCTATFPVY